MTPKAHKKSDYERLVAQETLILEATELIVELLERHSISRQDLARKLGKSKGFVTQLLSGERNMTLRTLADLGYVLGQRIELNPHPLGGDLVLEPGAPRNQQLADDGHDTDAANSHEYALAA
jgi:transcriptional regulator with XRE-family HTH domain